jgi:hypothetical protein
MDAGSCMACATAGDGGAPVASTSGYPILLHYRKEAGHMPTLPLDATIDELADQLVFLFRELDVSSS